MVQTVSGAGDLAHVLRDLAADGDLVICMGAGDITKWAAGLAEAVRAEREAIAPLPLAAGGGL
jgi:UDP-N-acetylmuramate--alanine ligase